MNRRRMNADEGVTLVELLVVVVIIGIIASIALPVFMNQKSRAEVAAVKSGLSSMARQVATLADDGQSYADPQLYRDAFKASHLQAAVAAPNRTWTYAFCVDTDEPSWAVIAWKVVANNHKKAPYVSSRESAAVSTFDYDNATPGANAIDKACNQVLPGQDVTWWGHDAAMQAP